MAIHQHPLYSPLEEATTVWRYMSLDKFESLLAESHLFFCRADKFSDIYEGSLPRREAEFRIEAERINAERFGEVFDERLAWERIIERSAFHRRFKRSTVVNCWHINENESDGMWHLYMKDNDGVAIRSNGARLREAFETIPEAVEMSKVRYLDYDRDIWFHPEEFPHGRYNMITPLIHKRIEFAHEREFRIFRQIDEALNVEDYWGGQKGLGITIDLHTLIGSVVMHPLIDEAGAEKVRALLARYGYEFPLSVSSLTSKPYY